MFLTINLKQLNTDQSYEVYPAGLQPKLVKFRTEIFEIFEICAKCGKNEARPLIYARSVHDLPICIRSRSAPRTQHSRLGASAMICYLANPPER